MAGVRYDYQLFLDHDGRYEREERSEAGILRADVGRWENDKSENTLRLMPDSPTENKDKVYWVLSIRGCEPSNVILVLRQAILASRNLPIIFYRVYADNDRAYGTGWRKHLPSDT